MASATLFLFLANIQQTVHDFAISFFRSSKAKGMFFSRLDGIKGLGPKKKEKLLTTYESIDRIKNLSDEEFRKSGINAELALSIYDIIKKVWLRCNMNFNELSINENILKAINELGYNELMPIQKEAIPYILDGVDVIGQAQTGTGKTAAFGIPLIEKSSKNNKFIEHLIVSPTRELATQIKKELETLAKYANVKIGLILGGNSYYEEKKMLKSIPNIIVATPGRLLDHIKSNKIDVSQVKSLTLDEADEMLDIGFKDELTEIISSMPENRQGLLFSATLNDGVKDIARKLLHDPKEILVSEGLKASESVTQYAVIVEEKDKLRILLRYLQIDNPKSAIIFGRTKKRVDELSKALSSQGFRARGLHGLL